MFGYCKGTNRYTKFTYVYTKCFIQKKIVVFMEDRNNIENYLEMCQTKNSEVPTVVIVDEYSKSLVFDNNEDIEKRKERVEDNHVANQETKEKLARNNGDVEKIGEKHKYPIKKL